VAGNPDHWISGANLWYNYGPGSKLLNNGTGSFFPSVAFTKTNFKRLLFTYAGKTSILYLRFVISKIRKDKTRYAYFESP
jgi:hypothetical protein